MVKFLIKSELIYLVLQLCFKTSANPILIHAQISSGKNVNKAIPVTAFEKIFSFTEEFHSSRPVQLERHWEKYT